MHEWVWVQEGSIWRCPYAWGASPGVAIEQPPTSERSSLPSLLSPPSDLNLPPLQFFPDPLGSHSLGDPGCHTWSNCGSFSGITLLQWWTRQYSLMTGLLYQLHLTVLHPLQQRTRPPSHHWVLGLSLPQFHCLQLLQIGLWRCGYSSTSWMEIDFPGVRMSYVWAPSGSGFWEQRISGFHPSSNFQAARSNSE